MFSKVLIANRGEIAVRIIHTLSRLGIASVAVYSDADVGAPHVRAAGEAVRIGPAPVPQSYLNIERVLDAAVRCGAQALHPGYGFLSENAAFAQASADAGIIFIGPPPSAITSMGDKIRAKETVAAAGVPVVPGAGRHGMPDEEIIAALDGVGFPLLIKPSAGGGGKGMSLVRSAAELPGALAAARRTAEAAFGDDTLLVERFIERPQHIDGCAGLRPWCWRSCGSHNNGLAHPCRFQHDIALNRIERAGIEVRRLQLAKIRRGDNQKEAAGRSGCQLETAIGSGDR